MFYHQMNALNWNRSDYFLHHFRICKQHSWNSPTKSMFWATFASATIWIPFTASPPNSNFVPLTLGNKLFCLYGLLSTDISIVDDIDTLHPSDDITVYVSSSVEQPAEIFDISLICSYYSFESTKLLVPIHKQNRSLSIHKRKQITN